jgi:hypothetical protein
MKATDPQFAAAKPIAAQLLAQIARKQRLHANAGPCTIGEPCHTDDRTDVLDTPAR